MVLNRCNHERQTGGGTWCVDPDTLCVLYRMEHVYDGGGPQTDTVLYYVRQAQEEYAAGVDALRRANVRLTGFPSFRKATHAAGTDDNGSMGEATTKRKRPPPNACYYF